MSITKNNFDKMKKKTIKLDGFNNLFGQEKTNFKKDGLW